ncbi:MAG: FeoA family protein [Candidatus Pseudoruminococcus sp.]|uniref:FeoA family protein n=1 Tax=Candidatus Pseudoruminococcus sp. TaxID=3101048 RepID=UPI002A7E5556|nr:ferrous iron transport protein A [Ruminococcus sp.]MDY2781957.1 FeoA family protein [Candidatus Pseudoruminococcus sp.]
MPLTMAETGVENQIKKIGGKSDVRLFLEKLGFVVGSIVTVISQNNGNLIVNIKDTRVAISKEMACKIMV